MLREKFPRTRTADLARALDRNYSQIAAKACKLGLRKSAEYYAAGGGKRLDGVIGSSTRFKTGHTPANKGVRRPGFAPGRMGTTQFKKGHFPANRDPGFYVLGALRVNTDGYVEMRVSFAPGALGWRTLHRILWEDAHGAIPHGHCLVFKDGDRLNVELANIELITLTENMRRNTIHNLPGPLVRVIQLRSALVRAINKRERKHGQDHR
ncbi:MAG: HNH endonuclease signature motif containing protein [Sinimarinibacterium sp.]